MARGLKKSLFIQLTALTSAIMLFLLSAFVFTNRHIKREAERNTLELNDKVLSQIEKNVEDYDSIINHVATIFAYSPTIYKYFTQDSMSQVISMEDVSTVFSNIALLEKNISGVYLFDKNMKRLAGMGKGMEAFENAASNHLIKDEMEYSELFCLPNSNVPYYMVYFPVFNLESREYRNQIGMCVLIMKRDRFGEMLEDSRVTEHSEIYILDKDQEIAAMTGEYNFGSIEDDKLVSSDAYLVEARELEIGGWEVVSRIPRSELTEHVSKSKYFIGMAYLLALGLMASLMVFCYNKILIPIRKLDEFVTSAAMNPKMRMCVDREDEIGTVSKSMNEMLDDIESMNEKIRTAQERALKAEVSEKQLQVLAYQNQINPHFLYNTFDCIRAMALYYDVEEIAEITMALSKVFRFAVKGDNVVEVEDEVNYIQEYAKIIQYRFMGKIRIIVNLEEAVRKKKVIKLILQPLVENAVFHGLERKIERGEVRVRISKGSEFPLLLVVEDNGCGIEEDMLADIRSGLEKEKSGNGIGIANIYQRLKLFYGNDMHFQIESEYGKGTRIEIGIPDEITWEV